MALFEPIGRFFFERIHPWVLFFLLSIPFLLAFSLLAPRFYELREIEQSFDAAALRGRSALEKRSQKERYLQRYTNVEPYFIDQSLESLPLLRKELENLRLIKNHPACANRDELDRRISFLEEGDNRLSFAEENNRSSKRVKETDERLLHPVEIDSDDLEHLLCLIESLPIGAYAPALKSPQLLIQNFLLKKKERDIYELDLTLLKREFISPNEKKN